MKLTVAAALGLGLLAAGGAADPPAPAASVRDAVYFGPAGPVRIRLHISIDGRSADAAWDAAVDGLFAHCDRNGDGVLDTAERAAFAPPARRPRELDPDEPAAQPPRLAFNPKDEKVTRAAFADAVRAAGRGAVGRRVGPARADSRQLSEALFRRLDSDGDGRLSADELRAARDRLAALDVDEDEYVTAAELLGRGVGTNGGRVRVGLSPGRPAEEPAESSPDLLFLSPDGVLAVKQVL